MKRKTYVLICVAFLAALSVGGCATRQPDGLARVEHIVVLYAENRSFDHLYGLFPGAEGLAQAAEQKTQLDHDGRPLAHLPPVYDGAKVNPRFPQNLPNGPFQIDAPPINARADEVLPSPIHNYYQNREQINGGKNNLFVAMTTVGAWTMGYFDGSKMKLWNWAKEYTLADHFFMGAFGGSYLNHQYLICACVPMDPGAPANAKAQLDDQGRLKKRPESPASVLQGPVQLYDGRLAPDGYVVNTSQPPYQPSGIPPAPGGSFDLANPAGHPLPPQTLKTIGDTLSAKGVSWAWYAGGYNAALADGRQDPSIKRSIIYTRAPGSPIYQPHHQPFNYYARFAPGTAERAQHLKDGEDFAPGGLVLQARGRRQRAPELYGPRDRGHAHRHAPDPPARKPAVGKHGRDRHLRRERRLLGPHAAAVGAGLERPLGSGNAGPHAHHFAACQARLRRQDTVRHDVDPQAHHAALRPRAAARRAREDG